MKEQNGRLSAQVSESNQNDVAEQILQLRAKLSDVETAKKEAEMRLKRAEKKMLGIVDGNDRLILENGKKADRLRELEASLSETTEKNAQLESQLLQSKPDADLELGDCSRVAAELSRLTTSLAKKANATAV